MNTCDYATGGGYGMTDRDPYVIRCGKQAIQYFTQVHIGATGSVYYARCEEHQSPTYNKRLHVNLAGEMYQE